MKGIILAGGRGTRLYPCTKGISKQLLAVYDKPLIYYPLSVLLLADIREILIITAPESRESFMNLLGDGSQLGIRLTYCEQPTPGGLAEAFLLGKDFIGQDEVCLVLGDNVFYGNSLSKILRRARTQVEEHGGARIFAYPVHDPGNFAVAELDERGRVLSLEEKPQEPKSNYAVPGLYFYDHTVVEIAEAVRPSARGEREITSVNQIFLEQGRLSASLLGRGIAWIDTGTLPGMLKASNFIESVQGMQGFYISCIEEIAWRQGYIGTEQLRALGEEMRSSEYGRYLIGIAESAKREDEP